MVSALWLCYTFQPNCFTLVERRKSERNECCCVTIFQNGCSKVKPWNTSFVSGTVRFKSDKENKVLILRTIFSFYIGFCDIVFRVKLFWEILFFTILSISCVTLDLTDVFPVGKVSVWEENLLTINKIMFYIFLIFYEILFSVLTVQGLFLFNMTAWQLW